MKAKDTNLALYLASFLIDVVLGIILIAVPLLAIHLKEEGMNRMFTLEQAAERRGLHINFYQSRPGFIAS